MHTDEFLYCDEELGWTTTSEMRAGACLLHGSGKGVGTLQWGVSEQTAEPGAGPDAGPDAGPETDFERNLRVLQKMDVLAGYGGFSDFYGVDAK